MRMPIEKSKGPWKKGKKQINVIRPTTITSLRKQSTPEKFEEEKNELIQQWVDLQNEYSYLNKQLNQLDEDSPESIDIGKEANRIEKQIGKIDNILEKKYKVNTDKFF